MITDKDADRLYDIVRAIEEAKQVLGEEHNAAMDDMLWLIEKWKESRELASRYQYTLREIDTHIRSTPEPVPYIIETLKRTLPEYKED